MLAVSTLTLAAKELPVLAGGSTYQGWKSQCLSNGFIELQVLPDIGGRVIQFKLGDNEFLWVNPQLAGKLPTASGLAADGGWFNAGGDKLWPAPQGWDGAAQWPGPPDAVLDGQPLTLGVWGGPAEISNRQLELSDVISFHLYGSANDTSKKIADLRKRDRPVICTEWMGRSRQSLFSSVLPLFKTERVGCYNWGLVNGRTQTHFPWGSPKGAPEPVLWFHDIFRKDGTPYDPSEIRIIKQTTGKLPLR